MEIYTTLSHSRATDDRCKSASKEALPKNMELDIDNAPLDLENVRCDFGFCKARLFVFEVSVSISWEVVMSLVDLWLRIKVSKCMWLCVFQKLWFVMSPFQRATFNFLLHHAYLRAPF